MKLAILHLLLLFSVSFFSYASISSSLEPNALMEKLLQMRYQILEREIIKLEKKVGEITVLAQKMESDPKQVKKEAKKLFKKIPKMIKNIIEMTSILAMHDIREIGEVENTILEKKTQLMEQEIGELAKNAERIVDMAKRLESNPQQVKKEVEKLVEEIQKMIRKSLEIMHMLATRNIQGTKELEKRAQELENRVQELEKIVQKLAKEATLTIQGMVSNSQRAKEEVEKMASIIVRVELGIMKMTRTLLKRNIEPEQLEKIIELEKNVFEIIQEMESIPRQVREEAEKFVKEIPKVLEKIIEVVSILTMQNTQEKVEENTLLEKKVQIYKAVEIIGIEIKKQTEEIVKLNTQSTRFLLQKKKTIPILGKLLLMAIERQSHFEEISLLGTYTLHEECKPMRFFFYDISGIFTIVEISCENGVIELIGENGVYEILIKNHQQLRKVRENVDFLKFNYVCNISSTLNEVSKCPASLKRFNKSMVPINFDISADQEYVTSDHLLYKGFYYTNKKKSESCDSATETTYALFGSSSLNYAIPVQSGCKCTVKLNSILLCNCGDEQYSFDPKNGILTANQVKFLTANIRGLKVLTAKTNTQLSALIDITTQELENKKLKTLQ
ncbi:uncharacterized protein ELE39_002955 [Cryptosporidium sp. chipmunk genotype I]|uniref:uncharacterized protein n=1 Tax=Cryptosporidium sp. chipmunk genotype I TaxID=1280935 RepID=UPI00351A0A0A|nr:hypothetical protein ELE39_002955 [Cryptosporidium sp. chipmunk genotype I]